MQRDAEPRTATLNVATYNVHRCVGVDRRCDPARVARVLDELDCELIGLQEVDTRPGRGHESLQLDYLAAKTGMHAVPGLTIVRHDGHYGNALLTRLPVLEVRRHDLSCRGCEPRGALEVQLEAHGQRLRVLVTHLGLRPGERRRQVRVLMEVLGRDAERPLLVLGDMNEWFPIGRPIRWLDGHLGVAPALRSFPSRWPVFALDRIWIRPRDRLMSAHVHATPLARIASDHLPVKAAIRTG